VENLTQTFLGKGKKRGPSKSNNNKVEKGKKRANYLRKRKKRKPPSIEGREGISRLLRGVKETEKPNTTRQKGRGEESKRLEKRVAGGGGGPARSEKK